MDKNKTEEKNIGAEMEIRRRGIFQQKKSFFQKKISVPLLPCSSHSLSQKNIIIIIAGMNAACLLL